MNMKMKKKTKQNLPPWQSMDPYLLSKIISHLSLHDQLFGPPLVCRSWLSASLHTIFPNSTLDLRPIDRLDHHCQRIRFTHLLKLALNRYNNEWRSIYFPCKYHLGYFATLQIAEKTPNISSLTQSSSEEDYDDDDNDNDASPIFTSLIHWENLKTFRVGSNPLCGYQVLNQLADHCHKITEICISGARVMEKEASCIVDGFPRLERLDLSRSCLEVSGVYIVLDGRLKCVKELNILECKFVGDHENDDISRDYLRIKEFKIEVLRRVCTLRTLWDFKHNLEEACILSRNKFLNKLTQ